MATFLVSGALFSIFIVTVLGCFNFEGTGILEICCSGGISGVVGVFAMDSAVSEVAKDERGLVLDEHWPE